MRVSLLLFIPLFAWVGCSSSSDSDSGGTGPGGTTLVDGGAGGGDGAGGGGGTSQDGGGTTTTTPDGGKIHAGNPDGSCKAGVPAAGQEVDTSTPTTVVGTGSAASCTFAALSTAVTTGGIITFNCGSAPLTIPVTSTLVFPPGKDSTIDGGGKITLDGGSAHQIMTFVGPSFQVNTHRLTVQHIALVNGKIAGSQPIPTAAPPCSQGFDAGDGGAIYVSDGNLTVIDSIFDNNQAAPLGPDVGGGAIRMFGSLHGLLVVSSTFTNNKAANGGAIGCLFSELDIYDSYFDSNDGTGHDANNAGTAADCKQMNNGPQYELGSGGNGGAMYSDGAQNQTSHVPENVVLCGDKITGNNAGTNAFGGGVFFTSNDFSGTLTFTDTVMTGNTGGHWTTSHSGATTAGTAVGTNTAGLTITNSTLQGVP